jgi:hypothetical protein
MSLSHKLDTYTKVTSDHKSNTTDVGSSHKYLNRCNNTQCNVISVAVSVDNSSIKARNHRVRREIIRLGERPWPSCRGIIYQCIPLIFTCHNNTLCSFKFTIGCVYKQTFIISSIKWMEVVLKRTLKYFLVRL